MSPNNRLRSYSTVVKPEDTWKSPDPVPEPKFHSFQVKPKETRKICEVLGCDNDCFKYSQLCEHHLILNNESKKCDTNGCYEKRSGRDSYRCKQCSDEMDKLEDELSNLESKAQKIVNKLNEKYNRNYSTEWYLS